MRSSRCLVVRWAQELVPFCKEDQFSVFTRIQIIIFTPAKEERDLIGSISWRTIRPEAGEAGGVVYKPPSTPRIIRMARTRPTAIQYQAMPPMR